VLAGRDLSDRDTASSEPVIVINQTMARTLWPDQDPLGKIVLNACSNADRRVVGVVGDVRHLALEQTSGNEMYIPMRQCGDQPSADLVIRSTLPEGQTASAVRMALKPLAPNLAANELRTLQQLVDKSVSSRRFVLLMLGGFALFALVLASLGIYGLISYSVTQRTQEIGIRMALGASARDVQRRIVIQTLRMAAIGMTIGVVATTFVREARSKMVSSVTAAEPASKVSVPNARRHSGSPEVPTSMTAAGNARSPMARARICCAASKRRRPLGLTAFPFKSRQMRRDRSPSGIRILSAD